MTEAETSRRVLVLEPFGGGSHRSLYQGWARYSRHQLEVLELPAVHWKWRSRHASLTLAEQANRLVANGLRFDAVFCSDMLNLPEWRGFACAHLATTPTAVYFHENQFTYPLSLGETRDYHFAYSNCLSAMAAQEVWFNSEYHRQEFGNAARAWLGRMPDYSHLDAFDEAMERSHVLPPGIELPARSNDGELRQSTPLKVGGQVKAEAERLSTIGWVSRWEHDKRPEDFAAAVLELARRGTAFQLILLGQQFAQVPEALKRLQSEIPDRISWCGFAEDRLHYWRLLSCMDVVVSTAAHEFFGIGIVEAVAAGAFPLLPRALAYPETMGLHNSSEREQFFYSGQLTADLLWRALEDSNRSENPARRELRREVRRFEWQSLAAAYDSALGRLAESVG
jgi:glycosyltransferase involved in cell wall biosynthesis